MKKKGILVLIGIAVVILVAGIFLLNNKKEKTDPRKVLDGTRTIMIYMTGTDLEDENALATRTLEEIKKTSLSNDVKVIIYTGGATNWHTSVENNKIYEVKNNQLELVYEDTKKSMGDSSTLSGFLNYVYQNYKSSLYDLVFWGHGYGAVYGYGYDEVYHDYLYPKEMVEALSNSPFQREKLELIGFDTCLNSNIEVASSLAPFSHFLLASEELQIEEGWNYSFLSKIDKNTDTVTLGKLMLDSYFDFYNKPGEYDTLSVTMIDLSKVDKIISNLDDLFSKINQKMNQENYYDYVGIVTSNALSFGNLPTIHYDLIDLYGMIETYKEEYPNEVKELNDSIRDAIMYHQANREDAYGINIYFPFYYVKENIDDLLNQYNSLQFSSHYQKFVNTYISYMRN